MGHYEILTVFIGENDERQYIYHLNFQNGFLPLSVGIEDPEDLTQDLIHALSKVADLQKKSKKNQFNPDQDWNI